jgi:hypothetical protein
MSKTKPNTTLAVIPKLTTGDDAEVAAKFKELFHEAQNGLRRVVAFGLYAWSVKLLKLKHGQFGPWAKATFETIAVDSISYRSVRAHMNLTKSALESCGVKSLKSALAKWQTLPISHSGEFLLLPDAKVPDQVKPIREKLFSIIDGKSARQLFAEFKQSEDDESDFPKAKRGRLKGQGGASKEQRAAAAEREEQSRIEAIELEANDFCSWIDKNCDAKKIALINQKTFEKLRERARLLVDFCDKLHDARNGGAR